ncbi:MAG: universal stress protein [Cyclobacteriaceae bacterium]
MNNTILIPTDLSVNSKAGIRFAVQLARQGKNPLVFYHCLPLMKPTSWSEATYTAYVKKEEEGARKSLDKFVRGVYQSAGRRSGKFACVVKHSTNVQQAIIDYASEIKATAICMSTRGAGRLKKIMGTHASGIIHASPIPVFVIPKNYRATPITHILYASDLNAIGAELKEVKKFSGKLKAKVTVYHYDYLADVEEAKKKLEKMAGRYKQPDIDFKFQKFNIDKSLGQHLNADMRKSKASLAVLFTNQKRGWFDRLFLSSRAADTVFDSKVPLLIFQKK